VSIQRLWRAARWLSYTLGVVLFSFQPSAFAAPIEPAAALSQARQNITNLVEVAPHFYRGAQPDYSGMKALKDAGVQVDVCLVNDPHVIASESQDAQALGIRFVNIPLSPFKRPSDTDILRFLDIVNRKDDEPVFVHCQHGRDRTGAMVAIYREVHDHWTPDQAYQEMLNRGFRPFFKSLSDAVFDVGNQLGMLGHKPTVGFMATHFTGHNPALNPQ
ncbi:MAG TPA: tyrosine-protein phosphatase, partial [Candidatus Obscuribacterales bacterium]